MNINFQNGKGTIIVLNDDELILARAMVQLVLEAGYVKADDREKLLRITLTMQAVIFRRIEQEKERKRFKLCEKCCMEIDTTKDAYINRDGSFIHQCCPPLKGNRP